MKRSEAIAYLTRCADDNGNHWYQGRIWSDPETCPTCHGTDDAGWLGCPGSRYGRDSRTCAEVAWKVWSLTAEAREGWPVGIDEIMSAVVNDADWPQEELREYVLGLAGADIEAMVNGYLDCQLWAGLDMERQEENGDSPNLDANYGLEDIDPEYVERIRQELTQVVLDHPLAVRMYIHTGTDPNGSFGYDFYLTREGHGAGFWDRGLGELGEYLTAIAKAYGSAEILFDNGEGILG